ncbi:MAG: adenylate/guanylate cyclase domain-containing protein [Spirochaetota bacterium]
MGGITLFCVIRFTIVFNKIFFHFPQIKKYVRVFFIFLALEFIFCFVAPLVWAGVLFSILSTVFLFSSLWITIKVYKKGFRPAKFYILAFSFFIFGSLLYTLKTFALLPNNFVTQYSLQIGNILEVVLLSFGLTDRIKQLSLERDTERKLHHEYRDLLQELEIKTAELADTKQIIEKAKLQAESLNEFAKMINSTVDLDEIFQYVVEDLKQKLDADIFLLQLVTQDKNELHNRCFRVPREVSQDLIQEYDSFTYLIEPEVGMYYWTIFRKKLVYIRNIKSSESFSEMDRKLFEGLKITSVLQIPLILRNEVIGIFHINKYGGMKRVKKEELRFIKSFCEQLAIAVNNSKLYQKTKLEHQKSENLLLNILPRDVAKELKEKGYSEPILFDNVSVLFTDFKGFTQIAERLTPQELVRELDACFVQFDKISERYNLEKLKTIGDSYMCAGGIPKKNTTHSIDAVLAALEMQNFMNLIKSLKEKKGLEYWEIRLGIHSGPLVAGVIGEKKFAYDVWGDTVNTASRMESSGTSGMINISGATYELVKDYFECEYRGKVNAKNKGEVDMYYVHKIKLEYSKKKDGKTPNKKFWERYATLV